MRNLREYLEKQLSLQENMKKANPDVDTGSPWDMTQEEIARFIQWNHTALIVELGEMMQEVGWKPWASARFANHPQAMQEMVDAWHFFLNILLALAAMNHMSIWEMAVQFDDYYTKKNEKNHQRQVDGYDGISGKCKECGRDLTESHVFRTPQPDGSVAIYCQCGVVLATEEKNT